MQLRTEVSEIGGWTVVTVYGEVDVATAPELREVLVRLVGEGSTNLVLDLDQVDFLDSTGLGTVISALKRARTHGGDLRIVCTQPRIARLFQITGLDKALPLLPDVDAAAAGARGVAAAALGIPARPAYLSLVRLVVDAAIGSLAPGMSPARLDDLKIAVSEACSNAIEAHEATVAEDPVVVRCMVEDEQV